MSVYVRLSIYARLCCERRRVVTLRGSFTVEKRRVVYRGGGMAGWVDSKEIDSNVALALIFSYILNVSLSLSLYLYFSLSFAFRYLSITCTLS